MKGMNSYTFSHISFKDLPDEWVKRLRLKKNRHFTIRIEVAEEHLEELPSEEKISGKLVKAVKESEASYKAGNFVSCETEADRKALFRKSWNE